MEAHSHQPLDARQNQIRLLSVDRNLTSTAKVQCHLEAFNLDDAPNFSALSYRWEYPEPSDTQLPSPKVSRSIVVNGKTFPVSENLANFLDVFHKQPQNKPIWLWIDQICINQRDVFERNHQVKRMSTIYSQCETVIIWLAKASDAYVGALKDPYFTRVWVVQEVLLARHIEVLTCTDWISWGMLTRIPRTVQLVSDGVPIAALDLLEMSEGFHRGSTSLATLLITHGRAECKDPRDHVYGILGLVSMAQRLDIDYSKTLWEVFLDTAFLLCTVRHQRAITCGIALKILALALTPQGPNTDITFAREEMKRSDCFDLSSLLREMRHVADSATYNNRELPPGPKEMMDIGNSGGRWWFEFIDTKGTRMRIYARAQGKLPSQVAHKLSWFNKYSSKKRLADTDDRRAGVIVVLANDDKTSADCDEEDAVAPRLADDL